MRCCGMNLIYVQATGSVPFSAARVKTVPECAFCDAGVWVQEAVGDRLTVGRPPGSSETACVCETVRQTMRPP